MPASDSPNTGAGEVRSEIDHTTDSEAARRDTLDRILRWYITSAAAAAELLSPGDRFPVDVSPPEGPAPLTLETPAAALEWFDLERPNLMANVQAALQAGLPRRAWELAMALNPIHAQHFTFDDWDVHSETAVTAAETLADLTALAAALDCAGEVLLATGNARDAADFHREAARMHRELDDRWQEALATLHLADCEQVLGHDAASREQLTAALDLLQPFPDARAAELRAQAQARLR